MSQSIRECQQNSLPLFDEFGRIGWLMFHLKLSENLWSFENSGGVGVNWFAQMRFMEGVNFLELAFLLVFLVWFLLMQEKHSQLEHTWF